MQLETPEPPVRFAAGAKSRAGKYLVFELDKEEFGVQVVMVREIMGVQSITSIPRTPPHIKGIINLRGKVVPIVDLRLKFDLPPLEYSQRTCIIVMQLAGESDSILMGIIVDGVAEVLNVTDDEIEDAPAFGAEVDTSYLLGIAKINGKVKMLLDIDQVVSCHNLQRISNLIQ
jgi:purine-binding chemotaxis protein CheW